MSSLQFAQPSILELKVHLTHWWQGTSTPNLKFEEIEGTQTISQTVEPHSRTDLSNGSETGSQIYHKVEVALDILTDW